MDCFWRRQDTRPLDGVQTRCGPVSISYFRRNDYKTNKQKQPSAGAKPPLLRAPLYAVWGLLRSAPHKPRPGGDVSVAARGSQPHWPLNFTALCTQLQARAPKTRCSAEHLRLQTALSVGRGGGCADGAGRVQGRPAVRLLFSLSGLLVWRTR